MSYTSLQHQLYMHIYIIRSNSNIASSVNRSKFDKVRRTMPMIECPGPYTSLPMTRSQATTIWNLLNKNAMPAIYHVLTPPPELKYPYLPLSPQATAPIPALTTRT